MSSVYGAARKSITTHIYVRFLDLAVRQLIDSGTFLTAHPSGALSATTPSRGPLEAFTPLLHPAAPSSPSSSSTSLPFPTVNLQTQSAAYLSAISADPEKGGRPEIRADAETIGINEQWRIKCQREHVLKVRMAKADEVGGVGTGKGRAGRDDTGREEEMRRK